MKQGRPTKSKIRQNIVEILYFMKKGYGYEIYKIYRQIYPTATMRVMYYHLKKGVETGEFKVESVKQEKGNYSWGGQAEKIYYVLDKNAKPMIDKRVGNFFRKRK